MDTVAFFRRIWPATGHYCVDVKAKHGFRHFWFASIESAAAGALDLDRQGKTVYHACASFVTATNRKADNAAAVRSLWLDLDVGEGPSAHKFGSLKEAAEGLKTFLDNTGLPAPMIVASGGGLHCYWTFTNAIAALEAHVVAAQVKALAIHNKFKIDLSRTADFASVLRPVGTSNRKYTPPVVVKLVRDAADYDFHEFAERVAVNMEDVPMATTAPKKPNTKGVNAEFEVPQNYPDSDPDKVAEQCAQIRPLRDWRNTHEPMIEPQWYAAIQVLHFCKGGDEKIHEWSKDHTAYVPEQTDTKIRQVANFGPASCATFGSRNPKPCNACPHRGHITGPIQLGAVYAELPAPPVVVTVSANSVGIERTADDDADDETLIAPLGFIHPPRPFKRTVQGIVYRNKDGVETIVYPYDLYLDELAYDEAGKHEVSLVKHQLPQEGWLQFPFRSSSVSSDREFEQAMRDNHVKPLSVSLLKLYLTLYMQEIQRAKRIRRLYASMGWKDGTDYFVLGERAYFADGTTLRVGVSPSIASVAGAFRSEGDRQTWIDATAILGKENMEAHAMAFSAGPGSILMKFTGFEGALFNMVGKSNSGKTSMGRFATSMYGSYDEVKLRSNDTMNAKIGRIGILSSLPVYIDEVTNEDPEELSDFVYEITQGRSKLRLRTDGTEREPAFWSTIVVSSSNTSLSAKLGLAKANPDAERLRLFEFPLDNQEAFAGLPSRELYEVCSQNFGLVGAEYVQYVVTHQKEVRAGLNAMMDALRQKSGARAEERMWIASVACGLYGLILMQKLGLIAFDARNVAKWVLDQITTSRATMDEDRIDSTQLVGQYFNEYAGYSVTMKKVGMMRDGREDWVVTQAPRGAIFIRYETTNNRIWVEAQHLRRYVIERQGDWKEMEKQLTASGAMVRKLRKVLGAGTGYSSAQVACIEFNTEAPGMIDFVMGLAAAPEEKAA